MKQDILVTIVLIDGFVIETLIHEYEIASYKEKIIKGFLFESKQDKKSEFAELKPCTLLTIDKITMKRVK